MESTKYESLINDLSKLESMIEILKNQNTDIKKRNAELEVALEKAKKENTGLYQKISALEEELKLLKEKAGNSVFGSMNPDERDNLKSRLQEMISRIDYHLSS